MYKRVEKRQRKRQTEFELGLDEDVKQILGFNDTDSDESSSDSDSGESSVNQGDRKADFGDEVEQDDDEGSFDQEDEDKSQARDDDEEQNDDVEEVITVGEALNDSIFLVSVHPELKACVVCPGKLLKDSKMVQLHRDSNAHGRRIRQFVKAAQEADPGDDARTLVRQLDSSRGRPSNPSSNKSNGTSKRAEKKKKALAIRTAMRERQKNRNQKKRAKPESAAEEPSILSKPAKRQKVQLESDLPTPKPEPQMNESELKEKLKDIIRSTSIRAKNARLRAKKGSDGRKKHSA